MEQTVADRSNKYIACSKCKMKFINDDDNIKNHFGYNRLNIRYKKCEKCRKYNAERVTSWRAEKQEEFKQQKEINMDYIPNRSKINLTQMKR